MMGTAKIEAFLRDLHELCKKHNAVIVCHESGGDMNRVDVGGIGFTHLEADAGSVFIDTCYASRSSLAYGVEAGEFVDFGAIEALRSKP